MVTCLLAANHLFRFSRRASRIRRALPYVPAKNIIIAPDCGMKYLPRDIAFGKIRAMVEGAKIVRAEVGGSASPHL
jgi:5-methyltetrahydropteroyltriglutamate--homocysteine methyltransferase